MGYGPLTATGTTDTPATGSGTSTTPAVTGTLKAELESASSVLASQLAEEGLVLSTESQDQLAAAMLAIQTLANVVAEPGGKVITTIKGHATPGYAKHGRLEIVIKAQQ